MTEAPHRAYRLKLDIEADTREALEQALEDILGRIDDESLGKGITGGQSFGYSHEIVVDETITPEGYSESNRQYLEALRERRNTALGDLADNDRDLI